MTTQEKLIDALKGAYPQESQAALARRAGLSVQRFNNYCTGIRTMDVDAVIGCAQALGWDIRKAVADHEIETAPSPRVKALWRKLAATAMLVAISVGMSAAPTAATASGFEKGPVCILCYTLPGTTEAGSASSWHRSSLSVVPTPLLIAISQILMVTAKADPRGKLDNHYTHHETMRELCSDIHIMSGKALDSVVAVDG